MVKKKNYLTVKEFAKEYGKSTDRIYEWLRTKVIKALPRATPHSFWRIPRSELNRLKRLNAPSQTGTIKEARKAQQQSHLKEMTKIAHFLTPQWIETRTGELEPPEDLTDDQLRLGFRKRLAQVRMNYGDKKVACLESHLRVYFPVLVGEEIDILLEKEPHIVYEQLWLIAQRGIDKGTCPICKDWQ